MPAESSSTTSTSSGTCTALWCLHVQSDVEEIQAEAGQLRQILEHTTAGFLDPSLEARWAHQSCEKPTLDRLLRVHSAAHFLPSCHPPDGRQCCEILCYWLPGTLSAIALSYSKAFSFLAMSQSCSRDFISSRPCGNGEMYDWHAVSCAECKFCNIATLCTPFVLRSA